MWENHEKNKLIQNHYNTKKLIRSVTYLLSRWPKIQLALIFPFSKCNTEKGAKPLLTTLCASRCLCVSGLWHDAAMHHCRLLFWILEASSRMRQVLQPNCMAASNNCRPLSTWEVFPPRTIAVESHGQNNMDSWTLISLCASWVVETTGHVPALFVFEHLYFSPNMVV